MPDLYTSSGELHPVAPYSFAHALTFIGGFTPGALEQTVTEESLTRAVLIAGVPLVFRVHSTGSVDSPRLAYTLWAATPPDDTLLAAAVARIRFYLSLDEDLAPFYAIGQSDPSFAPIITQLYGYHQVKFLSPFENAVWAILSQRTPMPMARKTKDALARHFGASLTVEGEEHWAFPEPDTLAAANPDELLAVVRNERKAPQMAAVAAAFNAVDQAWLQTAPYDEVEAWLLRLPGIGAWSSTFVLVRGLGRMERVPVGEERLRAIASRVYGRPLDDAGLAVLAAPYGSWQGYWAHYLRATG